jgi:excisionase family DNA binding protein
MRTYSTAEVAKMLGMHQPNLQRLIARKSIPFPRLSKIGQIAVRLWTARDVQRVKKLLAKRRTRRKRP